ncbi:MAG: sensor histidine kinase [Atribacterota bacterium]
MFQKIDKNIYSNLIITLFLNISATLLSLFFQHLGFKEVNFVVIYILSVLLTSRYTKGYVYGIVASIIAMLSFNFFFTEPIYTFTVDDPTYIFTFIVILIAAILTSALTSKLIYSKELASEREKQAQTLYEITSSLAKPGGIMEVARVSVQCLVSLLKRDVIFLLIDNKNNLIQEIATPNSGYGIVTKNINYNDVEMITSKHYTFPITVRDKQVGYVCLPEEMENTNKRNRFLLDSVIMQISIAMQREILTSEKEAAKAEMERERFKSNLLRAISHDLRTPLTGIKGAAEMLLQNLQDEENIKLIQGIYEDSNWLIRLIENILSLTRIQEGRLAVNIQPEAVEEIVAEAVDRASKYAPDHKIIISIPDEVLFIPMDGKLIIQVLINLIDNAIKHASQSDEIKVLVRLDGNKAWFEVSDNGAGINPEDLPRLFDMFFIAPSSHTDSKPGIGLGLAICKAIINFHGGKIMAENNNSSGATFRFFLNVQEDLK